MAIPTQSLQIKPFDLGQAQTQRRRNTLQDLAAQQGRDYNALAPQRAQAGAVANERNQFNLTHDREQGELKKQFQQGTTVKNALGYVLKNDQLMRQDPNAYQRIKQQLRDRGIPPDRMPKTTLSTG